MRGGRAGRPRVAGGRCAAAASRTSTSAMVDPWPAGFTGDERRPENGGRIVPPAHLGALRAERARLRPPRRGPGRHRRPRRACKVLAVEDHGVVPLPAPGRQLHPGAMIDGRDQPSRPSTALRDDVKPIEITQPEGPSFTVDGHAVRLAEVAPAHRLHPPRGPRAPPGRLRGPGPRCARCSTGRRSSEMFVPYGDPSPDPPQQERVRPWASWASACWPTRSTLGCDCLGRHHVLRRRASTTPDGHAQSPSPTPCASTRRTPAWRGSTPTSAPSDVEVRRLRRLVISFDRHGRQLRVRLLLVPLPGRLDRVRGQAHRRHLHRRRCPPAPCRPHGTLVAPGSVRAATTSTSSACGST